MKVYADSGSFDAYHSLYEELLQCPPHGVEYLTHGLDAKRVPGFARSIYQRANILLGGSFTRVLSRAAALKAPESDMVFFCGHIDFSKARFVCDLEFAWSLLPVDAKWTEAGKEVYDRHRPLIQRMLGQETCKAVIAWNEKGRQNVLDAFGYPGLEEKMEVVPLSMRIPKDHAPISHYGFNLVFLGTSNFSGDWNFYYRGGVRTLRVFREFCKGKKDVRLVMTGDIPKAGMWRTKGLPIDLPGILPKSGLERVMRTSDALFYPCYTTPGLAFLEAMRYHVPVVTTDSFANREVVDPRNGIVCAFDAFRKSGPYGGLPLGSDYIPFEKNEVDVELEKSLLEALERLYSDRKLVRSLGDNGFRDVSQGRLSVESRNAKLLGIYKAALE